MVTTYKEKDIYSGLPIAYLLESLSSIPILLLSSQ